MIKNIEITKLINEELSNYSIHFTDIMNKRYTIDTYEKYIQEFTLIKNTFKNKIPEFCEIATDYINKMEGLINDCNRESIDSAKNFIQNNLYSRLKLSRYNNIDIKLPFIQSLLNETAYSVNTIIQIYQELGYENLIYYIELLNNPNYLNSYLSDTRKQIVAMHYILYKTNHHSLSKFKRNNTSANLYSIMESNINNSINEIVSKKDEYVSFMDNEKEEYLTFKKEEQDKFNTWFDASNVKFNSFLKDSKINLENLEKTYSEKLKIEEPSKFMKEKALEYKKKTRKWAIAIMFVSSILLVLLGFILNPKVELNKKIITVNFFSKDMPVYSSVIILSMICLIIYVIRIFIKIMMSSKHLSEEYHQKYVLTYFYLSLVNSGKIDEKLGNIVLSLLFTKADTGLIKNDNNNDIESITKILTSYK